MALNDFPRIALAHLPTPLEPLPRLGRELGCPRLWVKRDDCTGLATGGNKTRKLEFLLADAERRGANVVITAGGMQSNHVRQTAAAAARRGLACEVVLERPAADMGPAYAVNGNLLIDRLCGARVHTAAAGADLDAAMDALAEELRARGAAPYVVPVGGSNPLGALGYAGCAFELLDQAGAHGLDVECIVHATGSAGTQAGLLAGLRARGAEVPVLGICVSRGAREQEARVLPLARETLALLAPDRTLEPEAVRANGDHVGEGYGLPTPAMVEAVTLAARTEGLLLDPVYTGKAMAGLADLARRGEIGRRGDVVFVHTGGAAALFAYPEVFAGV